MGGLGCLVVAEDQTTKFVGVDLSLLSKIVEFMMYNVPHMWVSYIDKRKKISSLYNAKRLLPLFPYGFKVEPHKSYEVDSLSLLPMVSFYANESILLILFMRQVCWVQSPVLFPLSTCIDSASFVKSLSLVGLLPRRKKDRIDCIQGISVLTPLFSFWLMLPLIVALLVDSYILQSP